MAAGFDPFGRNSDVYRFSQNHRSFQIIESPLNNRLLATDIMLLRRLPRLMTLQLAGCCIFSNNA